MYCDPSVHALYDVFAWIGVGHIAAATTILTAGVALSTDIVGTSGVVVGAAASVSGLGNISVWTGLGSNGTRIAATEAVKSKLTTIGQTLTRAAWASLSQTMVATTTMSSITLFSGASIYTGSIYLMYEYPILIERGIEVIRKIIGG